VQPVIVPPQDTAATPPADQAPPAPAADTTPSETPKARPEQHLVIPAKTPVKIHLTAEIDGSSATEGEVFPVAVMEPISIGGEPISPVGSEARIVLTKAAGAKKSQKLQFQLSSIKIDGKIYKVRSDTFEFNGTTKGKKAGKFEAIGGAVGAIVGGKKVDASLVLPADTEMNFTIKGPVPVVIR
jgi:hypothetical protein